MLTVGIFVFVFKELIEQDLGRVFFLSILGCAELLAYLEKHPLHCLVLVVILLLVELDLLCKNGGEVMFIWATTKQVIGASTIPTRTVLVVGGCWRLTVFPAVVTVLWLPVVEGPIGAGAKVPGYGELGRRSRRDLLIA